MKGDYTFISTPGHGYLIVPEKDLAEIDFVPTEYSLFVQGFAYLEEDCDAPGFLKLAEQKGHCIFVTEHCSNNDIPKRQMSYYPPTTKPSYMEV